MTGGILIVPEYRPHRGGGHLCRCMELARDLRAAGRNAWLYLPADARTGDLFLTMNFNPEWRITEEGLERIRADTECVILDLFRTEAEELSFWKKIAPVTGIDEGGKSRDRFDFLIDILVPQKLISPKANIASVSLLKLPPIPPSAKRPVTGILKVLVTFGQEDLSGLGQKTARALCALSGVDVTLIRGALSGEKPEYPPDVRIMEAVPRLAEHLGEYDLVVTHYGITAFEALRARTMVLLASPTAYHAKLARAAGFYTFNPKFRKRIDKLKSRCEELAVRHGLDKEGASLAGLCGGFSPLVYRRCPVCGTDAPEDSVCRFGDRTFGDRTFGGRTFGGRTYRRCRVCGVIYMDRTCPPPIEYEREYFFESYRRQYGKTYLEDFPKIKAEGKRRLKIINSLLPVKIPVKTEERSLLDIGCAYGPFLAAAREEGFAPAGIDPAQDAVHYVRRELDIAAVQGFFPNTTLPSSRPYDTVTLWFVIEHFTDPRAALEEVKNILKPGGILAFSTPSFSGVSGRSSLRRFLSASPADHFTIWSPGMCKKALAQAGFTVKKTVTIGHHPERFPLLGKLAKNKKYPLYWPVLAISKILKLGDTFEVYAREKT